MASAAGSDVLGRKTPDVAQTMQHRAPFHIRVIWPTTTAWTRSTRYSRKVSHPLSPTGIENVEGARRIRNSRVYQHGMIELQDAAAQAVLDMVPLEPAEKLLDVCAGDLGKYFFRSRRLSFYAFSSLFAPVK